MLAWLLAPGLPLHEGVAAGVDLGAASLAQLDEMVAAGRRAGRPARLHLKIDTGLSRGGATVADWPALLEAAAKAQADGLVEVVGVWSHFVYADAPGHPTIDRQLAVFHEGLAMAERAGLAPALPAPGQLGRHPDPARHPLRPGPARASRSTGCPRWPASRFGLRPAMTARARVMLTKRVPGRQRRLLRAHLHHRAARPTLALVPLGYADGVPRHASNAGPVQLGGRRRTIAGRVCMDQFVLDCGDDPVAAGDVVDAVRPRRRRRADRRRLGRGGRHHQLRDRHPVRQRAGAPGLRRRARRDGVDVAGAASRRPRAGPAGAGIVGAAVGVAAAGLAAGRRRPSGPWSAGSRPTRPTRTPTSLRRAAVRRGVTGWSCRRHRHPRRGGRADPAGRRATRRWCLVHGFCLDMGTFHFQRKVLAERGDHRMVFYDQPGHGRSGRLETGEYDLAALGRTLRRGDRPRPPRTGRWCWSATRWAA